MTEEWDNGSYRTPTEEGIAWKENKSSSKYNQELSPPHYRNGWSRAYCPPKKCEETSASVPSQTTDIYVYEDQYDNCEAYDGVCPCPSPEETKHPTASNNDWTWEETAAGVDTTQDTWTNDMSWLNQWNDDYPDNEANTEPTSDDGYFKGYTENPPSEPYVEYSKSEMYTEKQDQMIEGNALYEECGNQSDLVCQQPSSVICVQPNPSHVGNGYEGALNVYNTDQCIHTYNVVNTVEEIRTPEDIMINQAHLMRIAGEITEYEESYLQQLILTKDPSVKEALRRFSLGESYSLIQLLHASDNGTELLIKKDHEYAEYLASSSQNDPVTPQTTYVDANTDQYMEIASSSINLSTVFGNGGESHADAYASLYSPSSQTVSIATLSKEDAMRYTQLPPLFKCSENLCGMILKRVTSKKIFKKWNRCLFVVKPSFLQLYRSSEEWKHQGPLYWQTNLHSFMHVSPVVRKNYDNILVYTFDLIENPRTNVHSNAALQGLSFSLSLPVREVAVFGSAYHGIVMALHDALQAAIQLKVTELATEE